MELFGQALTIMTVGMALVFVFLAILVLAIMGTARIVHRIEGAPQDENGASVPDAAVEKRRAAAIAVALEHFRSER